MNNYRDIIIRPIITEKSMKLMEEDNKVVEYTDMREQKAYIRYRIDIWHRKSTTAAAVAVDAAIEKLGLLRTGCQDVDDPSGRKHKQMRYEMVIDVNTKEVYHDI